MTMSPSEKLRSANAISGRTARACDSCLRRRARWYCTADDAFLCQTCDSSVHSANPLARRHDRVRLKTASYSPPMSDLNSNLPTWHHGFKRKARTPRHAKSVAKPVLLVPDLETLAADEKLEVEEEEEQLLYRVPIFDPVLAEFCSRPTFDDVNIPSIEEVKPAMNHGNFTGFNPTDIDLAEFAADVENLLGQGLEDDSFCMDGLGLLEAGENDRSQVKTEMVDAIDTSRDIMSNNTTTTNFLVDTEMEFSRESLDFNFDCEAPITGDEVEEQKVDMVQDGREQSVKIGLRLDYSAVIDAWSRCGCSPWTGGERPQFNLDDCWPDFTGMCRTAGGGGGEIQGHYGLQMRQVGNGDGEREARVSRYREKRRTRLFSKKIRYEVRKLNAEKRPRMKGRFVKRTTFPTTTAPGASAVFTCA